MKKILVLITVLFLLFSLLTVSMAAPSIFINDDPWHRDSREPMIKSNDVYYIPSSVLTMFDYISISYPSPNNILICNNETGAYISALISEKTAAINGEILDIDILDNNGIVYFNYKLLCEILSINYEFGYDYSTISLRLYDENAHLEISELLDYSQKENKEININDQDEINPAVNKAKLIYIITGYDFNNYKSICEQLDLLGMGFTCLINKDDREEACFYASSHGEFILNADNPEIDDLNIFNEQICSITHKTTHLFFTDDSELDRTVYSEKGYLMVKPDFTITDDTNPYFLVSEIQDYLFNNNSCVVLLNNSYNSFEAIELFSTLDPILYHIVNIGKNN